MATIVPREIAQALLTREARAAEQRINAVRVTLLSIGLFVLMPIRLLTSGQGGASVSLLVTAAILAVALLVALVLSGKMRDPDFPDELAACTIVLDFAVLTALMLAQVLYGASEAAASSQRIHEIFLPTGYVMNALSGFRLSQRQVALSGTLCAGLLVLATLLDLLVFRVPLHAVLILVAALLVAVSTRAAFFMVAKTRSMLIEASTLETEALRVRGVLSRYVSQPVAETVLQEDFSMSAGRRQTVTVLFSDIRGFTRMSEALPPEAVVSVLNSYFSRMVRVVFEYDGMLDKYIGDGMMVVFGAPVQHEDHALRAVRAALRMREELAIFNQEREARGEPALKIGIGIHTGEAVIGNIGTDQRLDYTAIGDTVNTASRIESLTKDFATDILVSAETYAAVMPHVDVEPMPNVQIRGKTANLDLFTLRGLKAAIGPSERATSRLVQPRTPTKFLW